jgi:hypothetical protein
MRALNQPIEGTMNQVPENSSSSTGLQDRLEFLQYLSDFLTQFIRKAEALSLHEIAYFLSMASLASHDLLAKLAEEDIEAALKNLPLMA